MKISMPMLLFWVAIVLVPIVVSIAAIGIVPNDQSIPMRWDEPGLVHGGLSHQNNDHCNGSGYC